jgi:hypothetical protein
VVELHAPQEVLAQEFGTPVQCQRLWLWVRRQNRTVRPGSPLSAQEEALSVSCWLFIDTAIFVPMIYKFFSRIHRRAAYHCIKKKKEVGLKHGAPVPSDRGNG